MTYDVQILKTKYCEIIIIKSGVLIFNLNHENENTTKYNVPIDCCCNVWNHEFKNSGFNVFCRNHDNWCERIKVLPQFYLFSFGTSLCVNTYMNHILLRRRCWQSLSLFGTSLCVNTYMNHILLRGRCWQSLSLFGTSLCVNTYMNHILLRSRCWQSRRCHLTYPLLLLFSQTENHMMEVVLHLQISQRLLSST
jgi:hypothetical protein